jgi:hypothetical protein
MSACLVYPRKPFLLVRIALVAILTLLLCGWTTCSAIVDFKSCPGSVPQPMITSISPASIPGNVDSILLIVSGSGFSSNSHIMWNGNALQTTFKDSIQLQTTITQQTLISFGGPAGSNVQISVRSPQSDRLSGCPNGGDSNTLLLAID